MACPKGLPVKNENHLRSSFVAAMLSTMRSVVFRRAPGLTDRRRAILEIVAATASHPDARRVFREAQERFPGISLATVYRALAWLRSVGLLAEVPGDGASRFDANPALHHHLVCSGCGRMVDVDLSIDGMKERARAQSGFASVRSARIELQGLCSDCGSAGHLPREDRGRVKA